MVDQITSKIAEFIASQVLKQPRRTIDPKEALISSGLIDSFHLVDLALFIEDNFAVRIEDTELNADIFDTLEQLATLVHQRQSE